MVHTIHAVMVANNIALKECKALLPTEPMYLDTDELFYMQEQDKYIYIFKYGVIAFYNFQEDEISTCLSVLDSCLENKLEETIEAQMEVVYGADRDKIVNDIVHLIALDSDSIRVMMLNLSQSLALEKYQLDSEKILNDTKSHTTHLEHYGNLNIKGNKLKRYIGKVLNVKNKIAEHLYIFDTHELVLEEEALKHLDLTLKNQFDLKDRYRSIKEQLEIITENLELFKDLMQHKESSRLEWIIIILIFIEIADHFLIKLLG